MSGRERESELIDESSGREAKRARENRYRRHVLLIVATIECTPRNFKLPRAYRRHRCRAVCGSYAPRLFRAIRFLHFSLSHLLFFRFADAVPGRCIYPLAYQSARRQGKISKLVYVALFLLTLFSLLPLSLSLSPLSRTSLQARWKKRVSRIVISLTHAEHAPEILWACICFSFRSKLMVVGETFIAITPIIVIS